MLSISNLYPSLVGLFLLSAPVWTAVPAQSGGRDWPLPPERTGMLYLSGSSSNNIGEFLPDGTLLRTISASNLTQPRGITTDDAGNLVVVCEGSQRILILDLDGNVLQTVTHPDLTQGTGIAQSPSGNWYVGSFFPGRVVIFDPNWNHLGTLTQSGMNGVNCVAFDADGSFSVSAAFANLVYHFNAAHQFLGTTSHPNIGSPMSIALDSQGNHYLSNGSSGVVIKFDPQWNPLLVIGSGVLSAPQGVLVNEYDELLITEFSVNTVYRYDTQGNLQGSFSFSGLTSARNGGWQTGKLVLAREGSVNRANNYPEKVLTVNGSTGETMGKMTMGTLDPLTIEMQASSAGPSPSVYVLYAWIGEPAASDVETLPYGAGLFAFPTPLAGGSPTTLINSIGFEGLLGTGMFSPATAPGVSFTLPGGVGSNMTVTFQAIMQDNGSDSAPTDPWSATNAIVVVFS